MEILHLPPAIVPFLNALATGARELETELAAFESEREAARRWHHFHAAYSLDDEDLKDLENVEYCWRQVDAAVEEASLDKLLTPLYQAIYLMDRVNRRREQPHFSSLPAVNDLVMAGAAYIQGRGEARGVSERLAVLVEFWRNCRQLLRSRKADLKPEVVPEFELGLEKMRSAMDAAAHASDPEALHQALALIVQSGDLVKQLLDWDRTDQERFRQRHRRFNIPVVGADLELALETADSVPRSQWDRGVRALEQSVLPRLFSFWSMVRSSLVLPAGMRASLLEGVEAGIERLDAAVAGLHDERPAEEVRAEYLAACEALSEAFSEVERHALRGDRLQGTPAEPYWQAAHGALAGSVPLVAIEELLRREPPPPEVAAGFHAYLGTGQPEPLCEAMAALLEAYPAVSDAGPDTWGCGYCGFLNPLGQHPCRRCGASPSGSSTAGWEA